MVSSISLEDLVLIFENISHILFSAREVRSETDYSGHPYFLILLLEPKCNLPKKKLCVLRAWIIFGFSFLCGLFISI